MNLDLRDDVKAISDRVAERVRNYTPSANAGPGKGDGSITQITLGYGYDQHGWIALVFDTRPDADFDGRWQFFIEQNRFERKHWVRVFDELYTNHKPVSVAFLDGSSKVLEPGFDEDQFAAVLGVLLKDVLLAARDRGLFSNLPLSDRCVLCVDEHEGHYSWPSRESRYEDAWVR